MIIICAGMSRSGSTLQYQLISTLVERHYGGEGMGPFRFQFFRPNSPKILVYKSEIALPDYIDQIDHAFAIIRNPLDVAVSLYRFRLGKEYYTCNGLLYSIDEIIDGELKKKVMPWIEFWEANGAHIERYEDVYPEYWTRLLFHFAQVIGKELELEDAQKIVDEYSLERNYEKMQKQKQWFDWKGSMLTLAHIGPNAGEPGEGEKHLTKEQKERIRSYAGEFMERHGYV